MPQVSKPAALKTGHKWNKRQLKHQAKVENFLGGQAHDIVAQAPKSLSPKARKYYAYIYATLKDSGVLTNQDLFVVEETAVCLVRMRQCREILDKQGLVQYRITKKGYKIATANPMVNAENKYMASFKSYANMLGLSPASRSKLASSDATSLSVEHQMKKQDPLMRILKGKPNIT